MGGEGQQVGRGRGVRSPQQGLSRGVSTGEWSKPRSFEGLKIPLCLDGLSGWVGVEKERSSILS